MYGLDDAFYTLEAKRLPTPGTGRDREYVIGDGPTQSGGIERFKENLHGNGLRFSGMIAYMQRGRKTSWLENINQWILDLVTSPPSNARSMWSENDLLRSETATAPIVQELSSTHHRAQGSPIPTVAFLALSCCIKTETLLALTGSPLAMFLRACVVAR